MEYILARFILQLLPIFDVDFLPWFSLLFYSRLQLYDHFFTQINDI